MALAPTKGMAANWQPRKAALMTPWSENINPDSVWQEYPRPQMVRDDWMNLNGIWGFVRRSGVNFEYQTRASAFRLNILVPFAFESALSGIMNRDYEKNVNNTLIYRRTFTLPESYNGKRILLHFGAVDWKCVVYINGKEAGTHTGGSDPFTFDITPYLNESGEQEIQVAVNDPTNRGGQPDGKQSVTPNNIWYTPVSGIWQTVWLEPVDPVHIQRYEVVPNIDRSVVTVKVLCDDADAKADITVSFKGEEVAKTSGEDVNKDIRISIPNEKLWSPDEPNLYDLDIKLSKNGQQTDNVKGYFGMRKFSRNLTAGNHPQLMLNNKPIFLMGPLDQGWWPDGLLTPPSYEAMTFDLKAIKELGMNMVRKHIKVEPDLWYEWCDRNGLVVWQDMVSGEEGGTMGDAATIQNNFYKECTDVVNALKQHPSIGAWVVFNESWGQFDEAGNQHTVKGTETVRNADADPYRLINSVTGWVDFGLGDFLDVHSYPQPNAVSDGSRIVSCGEYGGINLFIEGHKWADSQVSYTGVNNNQELADLFCQYLGMIQQWQNERGMCAAVYTEITDVEQELNGLYTYDRKVSKLNDAQKARIRKDIETLTHKRIVNTRTVVAAGDELSNVKWQYTFTKPADDWFQPSFDDSEWQSGNAGFGDKTNWRTAWDGNDIWIRRHFKINGDPDLSNLKLWMHHDDVAQVYINGVLACTTVSWNDAYQLFDINEEALNAIKKNGEDNVIAIHCNQDFGGKYIDAGLKIVNYTDNSQYGTDPTGISQVETHNGTLAATQGVYNLNGQRVGSDADDLNTLPKGIYIVNGKKVIVR